MARKSFVEAEREKNEGGEVVSKLRELENGTESGG